MLRPVTVFSICNLQFAICNLQFAIPVIPSFSASCMDTGEEESNGAGWSAFFGRFCEPGRFVPSPCGRGAGDSNWA
jgi:hypothetical protein